MKPTPSNLAALVNPPASGRSARLYIAVVLVGVLALTGFFVWHHRAAARPVTPAFATELLKRGDIALTITATGNLEPTNEVTIGSELSGTISFVYVDVNDRVTKDQPLAKLDTTKLEQQTDAFRAALRAAEAAVAQAEAALKQADAAFKRAHELRRLSDGKLPSQSDYDTAEAAHDKAKADLLAAQASAGQAKANLLVYETDLSKAVIKAPMDGIILTRDIEPGQTVQASYSAPELFTLAENLDHMKLDVSVAEADIGRVAKDQKAVFTVDAWPSRAYDASVTRVSYGSTVTDNVVTYATELEVANKDLSLRPGMTATADIHVAYSKNVFLVPSAALRFDPSAIAAPSASAKKTFVQSLTPMPPRRINGSGKTEGAATKTAAGHSRVWVLRDGKPEAVAVTIGLSDERHTEVSGEGLAEGMEIITRANPVSS